MKIILNLHAILLLLVLYGITYLLSYISPEFGNFDHPYYWVVFYIFCGLAELKKIKGRVFFIPMWLIGTIGFIVSSKYEYQETGLLSGLILSLVIFGLGFFIMQVLNRRNWRKAQVALKEIKSTTSKGIESDMFFKKLKDSFYIPNYLNSDNFLQYFIMEKLFELGYKSNFHKVEVNNHYQEFIEILIKHISEEEYKKYVAVFHNSLKKILQSESVYIQQYMFENIIKLIEEKQKGLNAQSQAIKKTNNVM